MLLIDDPILSLCIETLTPLIQHPPLSLIHTVPFPTKVRHDYSDRRDTEDYIVLSPG
jgi:hypothetical protein